MTLTLNLDTSFDLVYTSREVIDGFAEISVRGFPGVREGPPGSSICTVYTAVADTQVFAVEVNSGSTDLAVRPCEVAEHAAGAVIDSLSSRS